MENKYYMYVGKWEHDLSGKDLSFDIFQYDASDGKVIPWGKGGCADIIAGYTFIDPLRGVLYCVDERESLPGMSGGGGRLFAFKLDSNSGHMTELSRQNSYGVRPSSLLVTGDGSYLLATNHAGRKPITTTERGSDGRLNIKTSCDEANTLLFPLSDDGAIGEPLDVYRHTITGALPSQNNAHPHHVAVSPSGELMAVCDKGGDAIYVFKIDKATQHLTLCGDAPYMDTPGSSPRYGVFHPSGSFFYANHETAAIINAFSYDSQGKLKLLQTIDILPDNFVMPQGGKPGKMAESSDLRISCDGKFLYNLIRGMDAVAVYSVNEQNGTLTKLQVFKLPKEERGELGPRGFCISPDGRFLLVAQLGMGNIAKLKIAGDGTLTYSGIVAEGLYAPANISFWQV